MSKYDIIGDIHGHANDLIALLEQLGYRKQNDVYQHAQRTAIFLGDFIDRGSNQRLVIDTVMPMVNSGAALAVIGNHEFNALAFNTADPKKPGQYLRPNNAKNIKQHKAFMQAYDHIPEEKQRVLAWFFTLPLWLELPELRVVHACWEQTSMEILEAQLGPNNTLTPELLIKASEEGTQEFYALETLLKGKEYTLPEGVSFADKDGNTRHEVRSRWWYNEDASLAQIAIPDGVISHHPELEKSVINADKLVGYARENIPVFIGHYWMKGVPEYLANNVACLDYSVAKNGKLVAYRFNGEAQLNNKNFIY